MHSYSKALIVIGVFYWSAFAIAAEQDFWGNWPQQISFDQGDVVVYQPQPEQLEGNRLKARAAVAVELKDVKEPVFGAVWFEARLDTDRDERSATIADVTVTNVRFSEQNKDKANGLKDLLEREMPKWDLVISMDRLLTTLEMEEKRMAAAEKIGTKPPHIIFVEEPAVLVSIDGEPRLQQQVNSKIMRVVNTPFTLLLNPNNKTYYLYAGKDTWYTAKDIRGEWRITSNVSNEIAASKPIREHTDAPELEREPLKSGETPKVIVATQPTELISSKGKPEFTPISGTDLLYMSNTESDVLMHIQEQNYYILLAGRWYRSANMQGPWRYVDGKDLPKDFAKIPEESEIGTVLYAVPGTDIAKEAVLDTQIPQTATVDRNKATLQVEYDGEPKFEKIKSTTMLYAVNTATPVIQVNNQYYACDNAVWFVADRPTGPWLIATAIPQVIYTIPTDSPLYHVTFVYIYKSTPDVVYVGYTPGYMYTYVYHGTIVYDTGYWYPGWYGYWYYPRPATWGYHVRWNPYSGWRFGFSYSTGPFYFSIGYGNWYRGGWWGPAHYRSYYYSYRHGHRHGAYAGFRAGYRIGQPHTSSQNIYRNDRNKARVNPTPLPIQRPTAKPLDKRPNNIYTDRQGNVLRKTDKGWEQRHKDGWKSHFGEPSQRPSPRPSQRPTERPAGRPSPLPTQRPSQRPAQRQTQKPSQISSQRPDFGPSTVYKGGSKQEQLERSYHSRQRGEQRSQYYRSPQAGGASRGGGNGRGGGGPRR
jgi:hypothetical protein